LIPGYEAHRFVVSVIGDLMFLASLFVLGGDFWDKVRALFVHHARVQKMQRDDHYNSTMKGKI